MASIRTGAGEVFDLVGFQACAYQGFDPTFVQARVEEVFNLVGFEACAEQGFDLTFVQAGVEEMGLMGLMSPMGWMGGVRVRVGRRWKIRTWSGRCYCWQQGV